MMEWSDEMLMAYADGELDADTAARLRTVLSARPDLAHKVEAYRQVQAQVATTYAPILNEPVPDRLAALLAEPPVRTAEVVDLATRRASAKAAPVAARPLHQRFAPWMAMAAAVVVGVLLSTGDRPQFDGYAMIALQDGAPVAGGPLRTALETQLASSDQSGDVRVGVTFASADGYCRSFSAQGEAPVAGLACRTGEIWQIALLERGTAHDKAELRTASGLSPALAAAIEARASGDMLNAAAERAARDRGWKN